MCHRGGRSLHAQRRTRVQWPHFAPHPNMIVGGHCQLGPPLPCLPRLAPAWPPPMTTGQQRVPRCLHTPHPCHGAPAPNQSYSHAVPQQPATAAAAAPRHAFCVVKPLGLHHLAAPRYFQELPICSRFCDMGRESTRSGRAAAAQACSRPRSITQAACNCAAKRAVSAAAQRAGRLQQHAVLQIHLPHSPHDMWDTIQPTPQLSRSPHAHASNNLHQICNTKTKIPRVPD